VLEEMVAEVWREVLGVERVGAERSFFDLGGHSLLALRVMVRLGERLGSEPPLQRFFEHPTVAGLAAAIEAADGEGHGAGGGDRRPLPPLEPATSADGPTPASPAQERLAFLQRLDPESTAYNIASAVRLSGPLDRAALGRAVAELTRRQQVLRTRLVQEGRRIVQRVGPVPVVPVAWVDLSALSPAAGADAARRALARQAARPFDLELDAPLRAVAVRLGDREHHLGLTTHHAMADGVSLGLMLDEITTLYRAFAAGRPSPLGELEVQYGDVARWQHRLLDEGHLEGDLAYWRRALADAPRSLGLPAPGAASGTGGVRSLVTLEASRATAVRQLARDARASVFLVVLSAYAAWLRWLGRVDDLVIGLPVAARDDRRTERLVGLFVHTLPLRLELDGSLSFGELVARVRGAVMEGHRHRRVPLDRLAEELRGDERATGDALFEVAFTLQTQTQTPPPDPDGLEVEPLTVYAGDAAFALNVNAQDDGERIRLPLEVDTRRFEPVRVGSLARSLASFLEAAVAEPERSLDDLGTRVAEAERQARDAEHERLFAAREASRPGGGRRGRRGLRRAAPVAVALNPTPPRETE
jgi:acyl carrier protein